MIDPALLDPYLYTIRLAIPYDAYSSDSPETHMKGRNTSRLSGPPRLGHRMRTTGLEGENVSACLRFACQAFQKVTGQQ